METQARRRKPWVRWLAAFLALVIVFTFSAQSWIAIKITVDAHNAAQTYLAEQTGYVNASRLERLQIRLQSLGQPRTLEDYYRLAETNIASAQYERALYHVQQCLTLLRPEQGEALKTELLLKQGCLLTILGRSSEAAPVMEEVVRLARELADAYLVLAQIYAETGETGPLSDALEGYLALQPAAADMRLLLAQLYLAQGRGEEALTHAAYLRDTGGADESALAELFTGAGLARLQAGDTEKALEIFGTALTMDDTADSLCYYTGLCCLLLERYDEAVAHYSRAIELDSNRQLSRYGRGAAELMRAEPDREQARQDLLYAAGYTGEDADPVVAAQAQDLLDTLAQPTE